MCSADKKMGLQLSEKVKISPWDILEGFKNPAPLSWAWFGSVKHDRKPLRMEEAFAELKYVNTASVEKKKEYFLEPPPLPQEDLEQNATAAAKEIKPEEEHKNQILQNLPSMVPSPMGPQGQGQNQGPMGQQSGANMGPRGPVGPQPMGNQGPIAQQLGHGQSMQTPGITGHPNAGGAVRPPNMGPGGPMGGPMGGNPRIPGSQMGQQIPMQMRMPTQQQQQMGQPHQATPHQQRMPMGHGGQGMGPMGSFAPNQGGNQSMPMGSQVGPMGAQIGGMGPGPSQQNWGSGGGRVPPTQPQQQEGMFSGGGGGGGQGHPPPQYNVAMAQQVWSLKQTFLFPHYQTYDFRTT